MAAVLTSTVIACNPGDDTAGPTTSASVSTPTSTSVLVTTTTPPTTTGTVTLSMTGVRLVNSEESDNALRVLFDSAATDVSVTLTGIPSPNRIILVCPANELERPVRAAGGCSTPAAGETVKVPHGGDIKGVTVVQVGVAGTGPAANSTSVGEIALTYAPTSREVRLRLPPLREGESGGRPTMKMTPVGTAGTYRGTATWSSPGGGTGEAELLLTAGTSVVSRSQGGPGSMLNGTMSPPAEATFRFANAGSVTLLAPTLTLLFP